MSSYRTFLTLVANAIAWAALLQWPWEQILGPAPIALAVIHLLYPLIAPTRMLPLLVAAIDAAALYWALQRDTWGELTVVIVPLLAALALIALIYAASVVMFIHRRAARRELARREDEQRDPKD